MLPVLLFAFASEDSTIQVEEEARAIQSALASVTRDRKLCDAEIPPFLKLTDIVDVFQRNRNRVSIFHYAGHANGAELLLRTALGTGAGVTGLSAAIRGQTGLKLVFLNGCSTERQVEQWIAAGVPCVIATTQAIHGEVAKTFASRFYSGLATGGSIRTAYEEAVGEATAACRGNTRLLYCDEDPVETGATQHGHWPWYMKTAAGAEAAEDWNLPDAAGDPLALLPLPIAGPLPESPYPGLRRFAAADAAIFFGRGQAIRRLYERVTCTSSAPIILLHGQSGVGKSSILEAGLTPRLQTGYNGSTPYEVVTVRIDPVRGVLDSLCLAFVKDASEAGGARHTPAESWRIREDRIGKPLLVILDQLEEAFTHANGPVPADWEKFLAELCSIFMNRTTAPRGKLILAFRTEWYSRINSRLSGLWKTEIFLDCLDEHGVQEAIEGPTRQRPLRDQYALTIETSLPLKIATELLMDSEASVAPTLQILLKTLWDQATLVSRTPTFTDSLYRRHRATLGDFVRTQIQNILNQNSLSAEAKKAVEAGLLLDFLECHVTPELTSRHQSLQVLLQGDLQTHPPIPARYPGRDEIIGELRRLCIDHYLLIQPDSGTNADPEPASRMAHDSLAPHVHTMYQSSDARGQRACRILEQRVIERKHGVDDELDASSLAAVQQGRPGMRAWTSEERTLVLAGRRKRMIRRSIIAATMLVAFVAVYWMRLEWYAQELRSAFVYGPEQVEDLLELARDSPWVSEVDAGRFFAEEVDDGKEATSKQSLRGLRAAMVLIELDSAESAHYSRLLKELPAFSDPNSTAEYLATRDRLIPPERWPMWERQFTGQLTAWTSKKRSEMSNPRFCQVATSLLLAAGHPEAIPENWYRQSDDPAIRSQTIAELGRWATAKEICRYIGTVYSMSVQTANDASARDQLLAVLCLALASSSQEVLRSEIEQPLVGQCYFSKSSILRSSAGILLTKLSAAGNGTPHWLTVQKAELDIEAVLKTTGVLTVSRRPESEWAQLRFGVQVPIELDFIRIPAHGREPVFWISATEVPADLFDAYRSADSGTSDPWWHDFHNRPAPGKIGSPYPANFVSWSEALNCCNWLSHNGQLPQVFTSDAAFGEFHYTEFGEHTQYTAPAAAGPVGFRLPTPDEWTRACSSNVNLKYHFGDEQLLDRHDLLGDYASYSANSGRTVQHSAIRLPNEWGLFDMHGNLREWCWLTANRDGNSQILRSSSFNAQPRECATLDETFDVASSNNSPENGFRLVLDRLPE